MMKDQQDKKIVDILDKKYTTKKLNLIVFPESQLKRLLKQVMVTIKKDLGEGSLNRPLGEINLNQSILDNNAPVSKNSDVKVNEIPLKDFLKLLSWEQITEWVNDMNVNDNMKNTYNYVSSINNPDKSNFTTTTYSLLDYLLALPDDKQKRILNGVVHVTNFKDNRGGVPLLLGAIAGRQQEGKTVTAKLDFKSIFFETGSGLKLQDDLDAPIKDTFKDIFKNIDMEVDVNGKFIENTVNQAGKKPLLKAIKKYGIWVQISLPSVPHLVTAIIRNGNIYTFGGSYGDPTIDLRNFGIPYEFGDMYIMSPDELIEGTPSDAMNAQQIVAWGIYTTDIKYRLEQLEKKVLKANTRLEGMYKVGNDSYSAVSNPFLKYYFNWSNCVAVSREAIQGDDERWGDSTISHFISLPWDSVRTFDIDLLYDVLKEEEHDGGGKKKKNKKET